MSINYTDKPNRYSANCRDCGKLLQPGEGLLVEISEYPWDGSDTEGSVAETHYEVRCNDPDWGCEKRVIENCHSVRRLKEMANNRRDYGIYADQARQALAELAELSRQQAITKDLVAREHGWGGIGGYRGSGYNE